MHLRLYWDAIICRLVAKRSVKLADIARFKELQQILRPADYTANLPTQGNDELKRSPSADPSPQRDSNKENADVNLNVFERLALRGNHEAMKIRRDSHDPFLTGTVTTNNSAPQVTLAYRRAGHRAVTSFIASSCSLMDSLENSIPIHVEEVWASSTE